MADLGPYRCSQTPRTVPVQIRQKYLGIIPWITRPKQSLQSILLRSKMARFQSRKAPEDCDLRAIIMYSS